MWNHSLLTSSFGTFQKIKAEQTKTKDKTVDESPRKPNFWCWWCKANLISIILVKQIAELSNPIQINKGRTHAWSDSMVIWGNWCLFFPQHLNQDITRVETMVLECQRKETQNKNTDLLGSSGWHQIGNMEEGEERVQVSWWNESLPCWTQG